MGMAIIDVCHNAVAQVAERLSWSRCAYGASKRKVVRLVRLLTDNREPHMRDHSHSLRTMGNERWTTVTMPCCLTSAAGT